MFPVHNSGIDLTDVRGSAMDVLNCNGLGSHFQKDLER